MPHSTPSPADLPAAPAELEEIGSEFVLPGTEDPVIPTGEVEDVVALGNPALVAASTPDGVVPAPESAEKPKVTVTVTGDLAEDAPLTKDKKTGKMERDGVKHGAPYINLSRQEREKLGVDTGDLVMVTDAYGMLSRPHMVWFEGDPEKTLSHGECRVSRFDQGQQLMVEKMEVAEGMPEGIEYAVDISNDNTKHGGIAVPSAIAKLIGLKPAKPENPTVLSSGGKDLRVVYNGKDCWVRVTPRESGIKFYTQETAGNAENKPKAGHLRLGIDKVENIPKRLKVRVLDGILHLDTIDESATAEA